MPSPSLLPLDSEAVLWVAALDRVPIEERVEWVKTILARVEEINESRASGGSLSQITCADCKRQNGPCLCGDALGCAC